MAKQRNNRIDKIKLFESYLKPLPNGRLRSYQDIAEEYGVSLRTIEKAGKEGNWVNKRYKLGRLAQENFLEHKTEIVSDTKNRLYYLWQKTLTLLEYELNTIDIAQQEGNNPIKPYEFDRLVRSLKTASNQLFIVLGQPINIEKTNVTQEQPLEITDEDIEAMNRFLQDPEDKLKEFKENLQSELPDIGIKIEEVYKKVYA